MKISVIMPVYNVEAYVIDAIESIINQTYKDIQLIIVNDGSTDSTGSIADEYSRKDTRVRVIHKQNGGLSSARNIGIKKSTGDFIYFIDGDDFLDTDAFEKLVFSNRNTAADVICFGIKTFKEVELIDTDLDLSKKDIYYERQYLARGEYSGIEFYEKQVENNSLVCSACLYIIKKSLIEENYIEFHHDIIHEDELFTRLIFIHANKILFLDNKFYNRRFRPNSITTLAHSEKNAISLLIIAEQLHEYNKTLKHHLLNIDAARFFDLSLTLLEKLSRANKNNLTDAIKRISSSPLSKLLKIYSTRLLILRYPNYNRSIQLATKLPVIRQLITNMMLTY